MVSRDTIVHYGLSRFTETFSHILALAMTLITFPQPHAPAPKGAAKPGPIAARPGMLFEFHPNIFVPGLSAAAIGDMVLVTETGNEILTGLPQQLSIW